MENQKWWTIIAINEPIFSDIDKNNLAEIQVGRSDITNQSRNFNTTVVAVTKRSSKLKN